MDQTLLLKTNSQTILDYITIEFGKYFSQDESQYFAEYQPIESTQDPSPASWVKNIREDVSFLKGKVVWAKNSGKVVYREGKYFGTYHHGLVRGIYDPNKNTVRNLVRDPFRYFNICVGVIDYLFSKALLQQDIFRIHAACISKDDKGMLICGSKATGKTTLLMKFLRSGYDFVADDLCYVKFENNELICHPFPKTIKINYNDSERFPKLYQKLKYSKITTSDEIQKAIIQPEENNFSIVTREIPITQIIIPSIIQSPRTSTNSIQPVSAETSCCVVDIVKKKLSFDLLIPTFRGKDLLNIDYLENPELIEKQDHLCQQTLQSYSLKIFKLGLDIEKIDIKDLIVSSEE